MNPNGPMHANLVTLLQQNTMINKIGDELEIAESPCEIRKKLIEIATSWDFVAALTIGLPRDCAFRIERAWRQWHRLPIRPRLKLTLLRALVRYATQIDDALDQLDSFCIAVSKEDA